MYKLYKEYLSGLENTANYRKLPAIDYRHATGYLDFSSNDYLALSHNQELIAAGVAAAKIYGVGASGSRLLSGNNKIVEKLENQIAQDKRTESSLIFNSGFQANFSVLSTLLDQKILKSQPIVFFDKLNHASLYQAVFLSSPQLERYVHNDMEDLERLLIKYKNDARPKFIISETIFGMDGDIVPLTQIATLARTYKAFLYLDEAHACGIIGGVGYGLSTTIDLQNIPHLIMGTFSKALGASGGYIACSKLIRDYLINRCAGFIYSTAMSPLLVGVISKSWELVKNFNTERHNLFLLADNLREALKDLGWNIGNSSTHIIPIIGGSQEKTLKLQEHLRQNKIITSYIRYPTVPKGSARIRIALNLNHRKDDIERLILVTRELDFN